MAPLPIPSRLWRLGKVAADSGEVKTPATSILPRRRPSRQELCRTLPPRPFREPMGNDCLPDHGRKVHFASSCAGDQSRGIRDTLEGDFDNPRASETARPLSTVLLS